MAGIKIPRSLLVIHLKAGHAQFNRKSDINRIFPGSLGQACAVRNEDHGYKDGQEVASSKMR